MESSNHKFRRGRGNKKQNGINFGRRGPRRFKKGESDNEVFDFKSRTQQSDESQFSSSSNQQRGQNEQGGRENYQNQMKKGKNCYDNNKGKQNEIRKFGFGYKRLEELCDKDPSEIIFVMSNKTNGFMDLFKQNKDPDWIFLLMKVSAKICSTEFIQSKTQLLTELTCNSFFSHLKTYILSTPTEKNLNRNKYMNLFFSDCLIVFQSITTLFPRTAVEQLKDIVMSAIIALNGIQCYCKHIEINETTLDEMKELLEKMNEIKISYESKLKEKMIIDNIGQLYDPPDNFRTLTTYPTAIDFELGELFLRPNILKGAYQDVEHYLDVQFRLVREDFIAPLREGIQFYKEMIRDQQKRHKKINNIRVYHNVEFENTGEFVHDKNGYTINFNKNNKLRINWEMAKRFMYGSLLLFTVDEFQTFFLGVVLNRKIELLKQGKLIVELLQDAKPMYKRSLTMVESEVFFEPYKCTMEALKKINSHNFPMEKYIILASSDMDYPLYIDTMPEQYYSIDNMKYFPVLFYDQWPTKEMLKLDEMQYRAFKAALTHEFAIIQGPPGTGKTFIGLKIMKTIINNLFTKKRHLTKPILVVCYTNHALDQFMEGILEFTNKVVRIGGQSKSELIENYSLRNITRMYRKSMTTNIALRNINEQVQSLMNEIKYYRRCSEIVSYNAGILELSLLKNGMPKNYHSFFNSTLDLLVWLFQDFNYFNVDPVGFIVGIGQNLINKVFHSEKFLEMKPEFQEDEDGNLQYEIDDPDFEFNHKDIVIYSITLDDLKNACKDLLSESIRLEEELHNDISLYNDFEEAKFSFSVMENIHDYFLDMLKIVDVDIDLPKHIQDLNALNMRQRWALYFSWVKTTKEMFVPKILKYEKMYSDTYKQYAELKELENIEILNKMHVIALTTTGAAKHRVMLEGLESPIVVVEEAAEVLEAHIIASLTRHCQHLILIGDHKQLRPSNAVYKLSKYYNFDISLFERMVNNDVPCYTLEEQHRMRPEISSLIAPTIYPKLKDNITVYNRDHIRGVTKDLFFLNHNMFEKEVDEISSKSNDHEATFLIMFARHLVLQGYKTDQVTILTTYSGQLFHLRSLRKKHPILEGMKITVVDNYQGEESDIILLSLVRSNEKGNVGFLKTENRICVALSRAKYGLYIMGNMDNLYNSGDLWKQIKTTLDNQDSYGNELTLECAIHSGILTKVSKSEDFNIIMEGGCTMLCKSLLLCGHYCTSMCHLLDRDHEEIKCWEACNKSCDYNHPCTKKCFMECGKCMVVMMKTLPCGHQTNVPCFVDENTFPCTEIVEVILEECGHEIKKKCHEKKPNCTFMCYDRLDCGHSCVLNCHKNNDPDHETYKCLKPCENVNEQCTLDHKCQKLCYQDCATCTVKVNKVLPCGHEKNNVPCGLSDNEIECYFPCERRLPCNHKCLAKCFEPCKACEILVKKVITDCGHLTTVKCKTIPRREDCTKRCERILNCFHQCKTLCSKECNTVKCTELVLQKKSKLACGHDKVWVFCCDKDKEFRMDSQYLLNKCREPCLQVLNCNDMCKGMCGECKQGRLHVPCGEICNKINPCNHTCKSPCKRRCPPCNQKCLYSCVHSKCTKNCGVPCIPCQENCTWQCPHLNCSNKCGDICNREPCYKPCDLKLQCGHDCIGFCGEPCPPLCRICQEEEVTTILFGNEDEPNARFVYLEDCKHSIESEGLENWINQNKKEIIIKHCPLCSTPILKTQRFMNQVKLILKDITEIKKKQNGELKVLKDRELTVLKSLVSLNKKIYIKLFFIDNSNQFDHIKNLWDIFCMPLIASLPEKCKNRKKLHLHARDIESLDFVINLFKRVCELQKQITTIKENQLKQTIISHFVWLLSVAFAYARQLSSQQKFDINMELARGARIINLLEIKSNEKYKMSAKMQIANAIEVKNLVDNLEALLMSCKAYNQERDMDVQNNIELIEQKMDGISVITNEERKMIHEAMAVNFFGGSNAQGHWCKCTNGHIYCITECGGPMEESVCPECKVKIGGQSHRHVSGITVASEMDGANQLMYPS